MSSRLIGRVLQKNVVFISKISVDLQWRSLQYFFLSLLSLPKSAETNPADFSPFDVLLPFSFSLVANTKKVEILQ